MNDRRSYTITIISFFQSIFPDFPPSILKSNLKTFFAGNFFWSFCKFFQKSQNILKGIWSHLQKVFKKPQYNGKFKLSCDRRSFTIIDRIVSHDHSRSWSLGLKKYEPHSLMIGNDREWSPITFRSPYHCPVVTLWIFRLRGYYMFQSYSVELMSWSRRFSSMAPAALANLCI